MAFDYCPCNDQDPAARLEALRDLDNAPPTPTRPGPLTAQQRGYCLESLLADTMEREGLDPRTSYQAPGEQIDGSFMLDGRPILLEAKWVAKPLSASALYAFKGKVAGKLVGTVGLVLAMEGFSDDAIPALTTGKEVDVIVADEADLTAALGPGGSFAAMVRSKLRDAAEESVVFSPYRVAVNGAEHKPAPAVRALQTPGEQAVAFVVEGPSDEAIVGGLGERVLRAANSRLAINTYVGMGVENSVRLAASLRTSYGPAALVGVVVDADEEQPEARQQRLGADPALRGAQIPVVAAPPSIEEAWLNLPRESQNRRQWAEIVRQRVQASDINQLRAAQPSFERFATLLERHVAQVSSPTSP